MNNLAKNFLAPLAFLFGFGITPAQGQTSGDSQVDSADEPIEEVSVIGSKIRGHRNPSARVFEIDQEDMQIQGLSSTEDVFRSITQVYGRGSSAAMDINDQSPAGTVGHASVDIGGFGTKSTLILINGRRTANSSIMYGDSVNINTIPISAIERIEVLPSGAAAIYGADAVGGVVNIILKERSEFSATTRLRTETGSVGGDANQISQDLSFGWGTGRFTGVASYMHNDPITNRDLGYTTQDFRSRGGFDMRSASFAETGLISGLGSLPPGSDGAAFVPGDVSFANVEPASFIAEYAAPETESTSVYVNVGQDVGSSVELFADILWSKNDTDNYEVPHNVFSAEVPASNAFNPYGQSVFVNYLFDTERDSGRMPSVYREADQELLQLTLGAEITLPGTWQMQVYATNADEESLHTFSWVASWADPAVIGALADGDPATALNFFGDGSLQNQSTLDSVVGLWQGQRHNRIESEMTSFVVQADGDLFSIPTGVVKASFSAEIREDSLDWAGFGVDQPKGKRTADSIAAEFAIPLLPESSLAATGQSLELTLAARWDRYNAEGDFDYDGINDELDEFSDTSPMVGLAWQPNDNLRLRTSWNQSFRAPVVHDVAGANYPYVTEVFDPLAPDDPATPDVEGPRLVLVDVTYPPSQNLGPEDAESWTAGFDWIPDSSDGTGLQASLTYSNTEFSDRISGTYNYFTEDPAFYVSRPDVFPDGTRRDANGNLTDVYLRNINIAGQKSEVWDLGLKYGLRLAGGSLLTFGADATYTASFEEQVHVAAAEEDLAGTFRGPDTLRAVLHANWFSADERMSANLYVRTSSSYDNTIPTSAIINPPPGSGAEIIEEVDGYTTVDVSGIYRYSGSSTWLQGVSVSAGVRNLLDEEFPLIHVTAGRVLPFDPRRVDPRGRVAYLELHKLFD